MREPTLWRVRLILMVTAIVLFIVSAVIQWAEGKYGRALFVSSAAVFCALSGFVQWRMRRPR